MKEMVGGCCVCSDERGWAENPLVYCDGQGCTVAVHQACYGIVTVPTGPWFCRKCESQERAARVRRAPSRMKADSMDMMLLKTNAVPERCELCPSRDGALKRTDNNGWAHVVCALYIPEVRFGNVTTMEPIVLQLIPQERFNKVCYICEEQGKASKATIGACMQCNKFGCKQQFHVTCAQALGLLCEEAGNYLDNVKYCGYCQHHYSKLKKGGNVKTIPPYKPIPADNGSSDSSPEKEPDGTIKSKRKSSGSTKVKIGKPSPEPESSMEGKVPSPFLGENSSSEKRPSLAEMEVDKKPKLECDTVVRTTVTQASNVIMSSASMSPSSNSAPQGGIVVSVPLTTVQSSVPVVTTAQTPVQQTLFQQTIAPSSSPQSFISESSNPAASSRAVITAEEQPGKRQRSQSSEKGRSNKKRGSVSQPVSKRSTNSNSRSSLNTPTPPPLQIKESPPSSPGSESGNTTRRSKSRKHSKEKDEKDIKLFQNGVSAPHMLGNQLNPASTMAQKMSDTLSQELEAHSIFSEPQTTTTLVGPQLHSRVIASVRSNNNNSSNSNQGSSSAATIPQSLDQLLERQWEQGSQFLMEQAQHFDIASLLSCLHQLRAENLRLEEHVNSLSQRRDHLLAVNARLAIPLTSQPAMHIPVNNVHPAAVHQAAGTRPNNSYPPQPMENGLPPEASPPGYQTIRQSGGYMLSQSPLNAPPQSNIVSPAGSSGGVVRSTSGTPDSIRAGENRSRSGSQPSSGATGAGGYPVYQQVPTTQSMVARRDELHHTGSSQGKPS